MSMNSRAVTDWPVHTQETRAWKNSGQGPKADRMFTEVVVSIPPVIAALDYAVPATLNRVLDAASRDIVALDAGSQNLSSLGQFLIRTESVASSKIEEVEASANDFARAMHGIRSNESAVSMVAASRAIKQMVDRAGDEGDMTLEQLLGAHQTLMQGDRADGRYAGQLRDVQNWIGGSDYTPRGAVHVPPPWEAVPKYMEDLLAFANRDDLHPIAQAAIVHVQFESVHPFTDGNGRIGRALIGAVLRRRGLTTTTVTPLASAMVANRERYFELVNGYRDGYLHDFVRYLARSATIASNEAAVSAAVLAKLPEKWATMSKPRAASAASAILEILLEHPVLSADDVVNLTAASESSVYSALERLESDGVIHEVTERKRDKVWAATDVLDELDDLNDRIAAAVAAEAL